MADRIDDLLRPLESGDSEVSAHETLQLARAFHRIMSSERRAEVIRLVEAHADEDEASRRH